VNTIEYQASDPVAVQKNSTEEECLSEEGWCPVSSSYPITRVEQAVARCPQVVEAFKAVVTKDLDLLGDNSPSVISSEKDLHRPWSWKVYAYKKRQVCSSEVKFVVPGLARDTEGTWRVIVQSSSRSLLSQTFALDTCTEPDSPCPGLAECGRKSRCVQRYNYHLMLAIDTNQAQAEDCPSLRAFRLPSGCVCHAETHHAREEDINF